MPGDPYRKVATGHRVEIRPQSWNRLMDLARDNDLGDRGGEVGSLARPSDVVKVRNDSGANVGRFGVLGLSGPLVGPGTLLNEFQRTPAFSGVVPATAGLFCVTIEPIASGKIGRAAVSGVVPVQFSSAPTVGGTADINSGSTANLAPAAGGSAEVLTYDAGTTWGYVRLANAPPAVSPTGLQYSNLTLDYLPGGTRSPLPNLTTVPFNLALGSPPGFTCANITGGNTLNFLTSGWYLLGFQALVTNRLGYLTPAAGNFWNVAVPKTVAGTPTGLGWLGKAGLTWAFPTVSNNLGSASTAQCGEDVSLLNADVGDGFQIQVNAECNGIATGNPTFSTNDVTQSFGGGFLLKVG